MARNTEFDWHGSTCPNLGRAKTNIPLDLSCQGLLFKPADRLRASSPASFGRSTMHAR